MGLVCLSADVVTISLFQYSHLSKFRMLLLFIATVNIDDPLLLLLVVAIIS